VTSAFVFPAISTGAFGFPTRDAAEIAFRTIREEAKVISKVRRVHFTLFDQQALDLHKSVLSAKQT
jgi:O-acetyl-ADP-ribose deacetylase (regulator of RNase III)